MKTLVILIISVFVGILFSLNTFVLGQTSPSVYQYPQMKQKQVSKKKLNRPISNPTKSKEVTLKIGQKRITAPILIDATILQKQNQQYFGKESQSPQNEILSDFEFPILPSWPPKKLYNYQWGKVSSLKEKLR